MKTYMFHLGCGEGRVSVVRPLSLRSVIEASVRSFDLLRDEPACEWVVVSCEGKAILRRTRIGGKLPLVWLPEQRRCRDPDRATSLERWG